MRRLLALFSVAVCLFAQGVRIPGPGGSAPAAGLSFGNTGSGEDTSGTATSVSTGSINTLAAGSNACIIQGAGTLTLNSVTDGQSNTYVVLTKGTFANINDTWAAYSLSVTGNATQSITANFNGPSTGNLSISCAHVPNSTGFEAGTDVVEPGSNGNTFSAIMSLSTSTPATAVIRGCGVDRAGTSTMTTGGYTAVVQSSTNLTSLWGKITTSAISSETVTGTFTNGPWWNCVSMALK